MPAVHQEIQVCPKRFDRGSTADFHASASDIERVGQGFPGCNSFDLGRGPDDLLLQDIAERESNRLSTNKNGKSRAQSLARIRSRVPSNSTHSFA